MFPVLSTAVDSCFDLVGSHQHGVASYEVISCSTDIHILTKVVMTSDGTQIQILANWPRQVNTIRQYKTIRQVLNQDFLCSEI